MFYKLSNTCDLKEIEDAFGILLKYPNLYEPKPIINGLSETNLPIITQEKPKTIDYAIWGLLPEGYDDDWDTFQDFTNTLNTNIHDLNLNEEIYSKSLDQRRCLIVVNGFFTSKLNDGRLDAHHVHLKAHKPFCIAGIYNKISDGFLTCSLLLTNTKSEFDAIPNLGKQKPLILRKKDYKTWLDPNLGIEDLRSLINDHKTYSFLSHPIEEDYYINPKIYKRIVNSDNFESMMHITED